MKAILSTLLVLWVTSVGAASAAEILVECPAPSFAEEQADLILVEDLAPSFAEEQTDLAEPAADEELTVENLENMDPNLVEAGGCCVDCFYQFQDCTWECAETSQQSCPTIQECRAELRACKAVCC